MLFTHKLSTSFLPTLVSLILATQLTACGIEESLAEVAPDVGSGSSTNISNNDESIISVIGGTGTGSVIEDVDPDSDNLLEVEGSLYIIGSDEDASNFSAENIDGEYGSLNIDDLGNWSYAANNNQSAIQILDTDERIEEEFTISTKDGTTYTITITIIGINESIGGTAAIITGADSGSVTEDVDPDGDNLLEDSGNLNITDIDAGEAAFIATTFNGNFGNLTINAAGNWNYAANNNQFIIQSLAGGASITDNITISSLDGTTHVIVITINGADEAAAPTSNINLSWTAPTQREDNTAISLSEISGYKISYGTSPGSYPNSVSLGSSSVVSHTFVDFASGTYYFVITTIDTDGRESQNSTSVSKTI